jgi:hypothetical protein
MYAVLDAQPQSIVLIISSDLAHTHSADGPYGYSPAAQPFDTVWSEIQLRIRYDCRLSANGRAHSTPISC